MDVAEAVLDPATAADTPAEAADAGARPSVVAVADNFVTLMRSFGRARSRLLAAAADDLEWSAHVILRCIANEGPMRASALAECVHSDPSTVSRQVAALVKDGLLERRADPDDGRASLLATTPRADDVIADHNRARLEYFADLLGDWSDDDLDRFAGLLVRFAHDYDTTSTEWMAERISRRSAPAGGTDR